MNYFLSKRRKVLIIYQSYKFTCKNYHNVNGGVIKKIETLNCISTKVKLQF